MLLNEPPEQLQIMTKLLYKNFKTTLTKFKTTAAYCITLHAIHTAIHKIRKMSCVLYVLKG